MTSKCNYLNGRLGGGEPCRNECTHTKFRFNLCGIVNSGEEKTKTELYPPIVTLFGKLVVCTCTEIDDKKKKERKKEKKKERKKERKIIKGK